MSRVINSTSGQEADGAAVTLEPGFAGQPLPAGERTESKGTTGRGTGQDE